MTTDMKEVIEWARANGNCTKGEFELLLALAEIGRLAVEAKVAEDIHIDAICKGMPTSDDATCRLRNAHYDAVLAFLARREGGA